MALMKNVSEFNKLRVQLFIEAVLNEGRLELIDELIAADFVGHIPCAEPESRSRTRSPRRIAS